MVDTFKDVRRPYQAAYRLWQLRLYENWDESSWTGGEGYYKGDLVDDAIVYIQDDYSVNRGTYCNKNIVFPPSKVTEDWKDYCRTVLKFEIPEWTQYGHEHEVLSRSEKQRIREEYKKKQEEKLAAAPNPLVGWDVITDVISSYTNEVTLKVAFGRKLVENGEHLQLTDVDRFVLDVDFDVSFAHFYTLAMVDPDSPYGYAPYERERRHWLVVNIPGSNVLGGVTISPYEKPQLPKTTGWHRFVLLLYRQKGRIETPVLDTTTKNPERAKFKIAEWAAKNDLGEPVGGFLFRLHAERYESL